MPKKGLKSIPDGLGVRIPGFHPGGPGSIPGLGASFDRYFSMTPENYTIRIIFFSENDCFGDSRVEIPYST